jgi:hypothetical protein
MTLFIILDNERTFQATNNEKFQCFKNDILFKIQVLPFQATHLDY